MKNSYKGSNPIIKIITIVFALFTVFNYVFIFLFNNDLNRIRAFGAYIAAYILLPFLMFLLMYIKISHPSSTDKRIVIIESIAFWILSAIPTVFAVIN